MHAESRRWVWFAASGVVALTAAGVIGSSVATAGEPKGNYPTNANGDTYGSAVEALTPDLEPDLVRVIATNGRQGYVYGRDLDPPELQPANPAEAVAMQDERDTVAARALVGVLNDQLDLELAPSDADALAAYRSFDRAARAGVASGSLDGDAAQMLARTLGGGFGAAVEADPGRVARALRSGLEASVVAVRREVPVYQADGQTRIGTFDVG